MLVTVLVDNNFDHPNVSESKFTVEAEPAETIENLKVLSYI